MTTFVILGVALTLSAGLLVVWPLWTAARFNTPAMGPPKRMASLGLMAGLALSTALLYRAVGEPRAFEAPPATAPSQVGPAQIEAMVNRLAARLEQNPDDPPGWRRLARSYETLGRFDLAAHAYQRLLALQPPDADLLTDYAVTLGMSLDQTLVGAPEKVLEQALQLNPAHLQALALSGSAAFEKRDYHQAIAHWRKLLSLIPPEAEMRASIERNLQRAQALAGR